MNPHDRALLSPRAQPLTAEEIPPKWLHQVRAVIVRDSLRLRAGFPACIDIHGPNGWQALNLPNNGVEFTGKRDRDRVLGWLSGENEIPEVGA